MAKKCEYCNEAESNGAAMSSHVKGRSNAIRFCTNEKCKHVISSMVKYANIMNRRLKEGAIYPARKKTRKLPAMESECVRIFRKYENMWKEEGEKLDGAVFPHPSYFEGLGIKEM